MAQRLTFLGRVAGLRSRRRSDDRSLQAKVGRRFRTFRQVRVTPASAGRFATALPIHRHHAHDALSVPACSCSSRAGSRMRPVARRSSRCSSRPRRRRWFPGAERPGNPPVALRRTITLFVVLIGGIVATPAIGAEYTVMTCNGQPAGHGRLDAFASGTHPSRRSGELREPRRHHDRRPGGNPRARRRQRRLAGLRARQHDHRRRDALPQGRRGRDGLRLCGARDHARRGQLPGLRELLRPGRLRGDHAHVVRVALARAPTSTASRSTSSACATCQKLTAARPRRCGSRARTSR